MTDENQIEDQDVELHDEVTDEVMEASTHDPKTAPAQAVAATDKAGDATSTSGARKMAGGTAADNTTKDPMPKTKAGIINAMYKKMEGMKAGQLKASYGKMMDAMHMKMESVDDADMPTMVEYNADFSEDLNALVESEATLSDEFKDNNKVLKSWFWVLQSKMLTGLGYINYKEIIPSDFDRDILINPIKFNTEDSRGNDVLVCGVVNNMVERNSKRGKFVTMEIDHNSDIINCLIWNETYDKYKKEVKNSEGKIIFMNGLIKFDNFKQKNGIQSVSETKIEIL